MAWVAAILRTQGRTRSYSSQLTLRAIPNGQPYDPPDSFHYFGADLDFDRLLSVARYRHYLRGQPWRTCRAAARPHRRLAWFVGQPGQLSRRSLWRSPHRGVAARLRPVP